MKTFATIILLIISISISAQDDPIRWKEIPMEDMEMSFYNVDPYAPAVVLCDYGKYYFNINPNGRNLFLFYDRHVRIKILKPEGLKYAQIRIPFHNMLCEQLEGENSKVIKGMVYNLSDNGKLTATKLKGKNIRYTDSTNCIRIAELSFPEAKAGSIIEYSYQVPTLDFVIPKIWFFQSNIPTRYSEFRMQVPKAFAYMVSPQNIEEFDISETSFYNYSVFFNFRQFKNSRQALIDLSGTQMRFALKNIEAFNCQSFITKPEDLMPKLNIHLSKVIHENSTDEWRYLTRSLMITTYDDYNEYQPVQRQNLLYPSGYKLYILPDWEKFNSNLLSSREFGLPLITFWNFKEHLINIIKGKKNPNEEMLAIYDYIRKNNRWNKEYAYDVSKVHGKFVTKMYTKVTNKQINERSLAEPFENKEGSSSEINFLVIYLLNKAGIEAHPVLISTRDRGKSDVNIPELKQFNHVLAFVDLGESQLLLDATDSLRPYQFLDKNDLNSVGFLVKREGSGWINIINNKSPETRITESIIIDESLNLTRKINISDDIYEAIEHRKKILLIGKDKFIQEYQPQFFEDYNNSQIEIKNYENDYLPLLITLVKKSQLPLNEEIKIQPNFKAKFTADNFQELDRKCLVDFNYPFKQNYFLQIELPNGYTAELPADEELIIYGKQASYNYSANIIENKIFVKLNLQISISEFPSMEYDNLKMLFTQLDEKLKENIVIRKSE